MSFCSLRADRMLPLVIMLLSLGSCYVLSIGEELQTYIIHLDHSHKPESFLTHESWHRSIFQSSANIDENGNDMFLYSYNHAMHGFSARLTKSQLFEIEKSPAHLATHQESFGKLFTTHTPKFLGLNHDYGLWPNSSYGEGVIIGIVDTGIWPESESFQDMGMPPVPERWKGKCENGTAFSPSMCNKKLIGARSFSKSVLASGLNLSREYASARDSVGHGTIISSIAAGNIVEGASYFGYAKGTAKGVAPRAHIAMYKVFVTAGNYTVVESDVLAAIDQAIADGVDILNLSLGFKRVPYFDDLIAIGSLSAVERGIFVVCAAGNDGEPNTTFNGAPWITDVGAGTVDRSFSAKMTLENGLVLDGISYYPSNIYIRNASLYYGKEHKSTSTCFTGELDPSEVHGKIVLCDSSSEIDIFVQLEELVRVGAYIGILITDQTVFAPLDYKIPSLILSTTYGALLKENLYKGTTAEVKFLKFTSTKLGTKPAPQVAVFSARGPDPVSPGILRPDVIAPGFDILGAMIPNVPDMLLGKYEVVTDYALRSGTSASAPHVAGIAALLKKINPEWSPAAIRSAIMTTTSLTDNTESILRDQYTGVAATPLAFGAGHVNPNKAMDPGLIYDIGFQDYVNYLCGLGYTKNQVGAIIRQRRWNCSEKLNDLNHPSFVGIFRSGAEASRLKRFNRVMTSVGDDSAVYHAILEHVPSGMRIEVEPSTLSFNHKYEKKGFSVSLEIDENLTSGTELYAYLKWIDQHNHVVSSPIVALKS